VLSNAVKFSDKQLSAIVVNATCKPSAVSGKIEVIISVEDNGVGLDPTSKQKIFQPFMQADSSVTRKFGGIPTGCCLLTSDRHWTGSSNLLSACEFDGRKNVGEQ
jgi:signal transduction histidine kinase